jgi:hypothetical protein
MTDFTNLELADCAKREVGLRRIVYPKRVMLGALRQDKADREIAMMAQIERDYRAKAQAEGGSTDLLGGLNV